MLDVTRGVAMVMVPLALAKVVVVVVEIHQGGILQIILQWVQEDQEEQD